MSNAVTDGVGLELTRPQVNDVRRKAQADGSLRVLLAGIASQTQLACFPEWFDDRRMSRSLVTGLLVLATLPADGSMIRVAEIARILGLNTSTTHRYLTTLLAVGLVERDPATRRYRLAA